MNDAPRRKLREIIERHGREIVENPRRVEGLLRDYCGEFRREISVLIMAIEEHSAADLLAAPASLPRRVLISRLTQRLCDDLALSEPAARWAVESWAWALNVITDAELEAGETERAAKGGAVETAENASSPIAAQTTRAKQNARSNQTARTSQTTLPQSANVTALNAVFVVSAGGGGNFTSINEALRNAAPNSRLLIREGLYEESVVLDKNVEIEGDGAIENIVVRSRSQSCVSMRTERAAVRGLTLEGRGKAGGRAFFAVDVPFGALVLENCRISSDTLSCVAIHGANANPFLKNCSVHDGADSGIYIFDNARASIQDCDVYRSANVNLAITQGANPTVKNCRIFEGENGGVVVWGNGAAGVIEDCEIFRHRLANVGVSQSANPTFRRCKIFGGGDSGVFVHQKGYGAFEECDVYGNRKAEIAVTDGSYTALRRCSVHDGQESGIYIGNSARALVENCSIYDNRDAGVSVYGESAVAVRRCNVRRNGKVAVRVKGASRASVEDSDLRGNGLATWETEYGVIVERKNNRE
jgi:parallel beta-helix repeat protein